MNDNEEVALREQLARLQQEHRDLDAAIEALMTSPGSDLIQVQRLKKTQTGAARQDPAGRGPADAGYYRLTC